MHAIRRAYPRAHITLLTSPGKEGVPGAADVLRGCAWVDEVLAYYPKDLRNKGKIATFMREMRAQGFELWFELPLEPTFGVALRNMAFARLSGAKWGYGWRMCTLRWSVQAQSEYLRFPNEVEKLCAVITEAGIEAGCRSFPLPIHDSHLEEVRRVLLDSDLTGDPPAAIAPGAKRAPNRWPPERFIEVGRHLVHRGFRVCVLGGEFERDVCHEVASGIGPRAVDLAGRLSILASWELLRRCALVVCNDSGVQHMAAAAGTPSVSVFSCRDFKGKWWPHGSRNSVLQKWIDCHTCLLESCPFDNQCIKLIEVSEVIACAERRIEELNPAPATLPVGR
jgi:ADP-heptose:LPS heptosyltransferase